jgi:hypothetical protein
VFSLCDHLEFAVKKSGIFNGAVEKSLTRWLVLAAAGNQLMSLKAVQPGIGPDLLPIGKITMLRLTFWILELPQVKRFVRSLKENDLKGIFDGQVAMERGDQRT